MPDPADLLRDLMRRVEALERRNAARHAGVPSVPEPGDAELETSDDGDGSPDGFQVRPSATPHDPAVFGDVDLVRAILTSCAREALTQRQIAHVVNRPVEALTPLMAALYATERVANLGTDQSPRWIRRLGDKCSSEDLAAMIRYLCSEAPRSLRELADLTGARLSRVNGQRVQIERDDADALLRFGPRKGGRWFLVPDALREEIRRRSR